MDNSKILFSGVMPALVSCVDDEGNVNEKAMCRLMEYHLSCGVTGFYLCGGTGEGPVLQPAARKRIAEIANMVGFSDALYFSRVFKQYCGESPTECKRTI